jgi:ABC-type bacteriocin/lantibiotic exporter with double-glycine peptidase domain
VLNVPFHKQRSENDCGLAAAAMITSYYHLPIGMRAERALAAQAHTTGGLTGAVLAHALRHAGYFVAIFSGTPGHGVTGIDHHIDRGRPLIVMFRHNKAPVGHYVVITGYDPARHLFVVLDPARGRMAATSHGLLTRWDATGRFTLLAVPKPQDRR